MKEETKEFRREKKKMSGETVSDNAEKENEGFATRDFTHVPVCAGACVCVCSRLRVGWRQSGHTPREEAEQSGEKKME